METIVLIILIALTAAIGCAALGFVVVIAATGGWPW